MHSELAGRSNLPEGWSTALLGQLAVTIRSGATPTGGSSSYLPSRVNYALIRSQNVLDHAFSSSGLAYISDRQAHALSGAEVEEGDVLLNITGDGVTFGRACLVPRSILPACVNQHVMLIRLDRTKCVPGYLLAWLTLPQTKEYIESFNAGGSRRAITKGHVESFVIPLPPLSVQTGIAQIVSAINDRIELLSQTNSTLEAIAQAIFKSWFVDFDPVHAKAEGREPDFIDAETAYLFPSEFVETEHGWIPKGWSIRKFAELATVAKHSISPMAHPGTMFAHHSIPAYDSGQLPVMESGAEIKSNKTVVPAQCVLQSKLNPHIPRIWLPGPVGPTAICSTEFLPWVPQPGVPVEFIYYLLKSSSFMNAVQTLVTGTSNSHQRVKANQVAALSVVIPPSEVMHAFKSCIAPMLERIVLNRNHARTLANLRDTLLPRLISGKLRVPEAEAAVEEVLA